MAISIVSSNKNNKRYIYFMDALRIFADLEINAVILQEPCNRVATSRPRKYERLNRKNGQDDYGVMYRAPVKLDSAKMYESPYEESTDMCMIAEFSDPSGPPQGRVGTRPVRP